MIKIRNREINNKDIKKLAIKYKTTEKIIKLLLNRGYKEEELGKYIQKDDYYVAPFDSITNCTEAATIIKSYLEDDEATIYTFGDYDVDGVMSRNTVEGIFLAIKESIDSKVTLKYKTPNRVEGYGLGMEWCKKTFPRKTTKRILVITVDNGITKKEEVAYLQSKGVEVIITDHHAPKKGQVPDCLIVDPWLNDLNDDNALGLCGAAVAYKICGRLLELYEDDSNFILNYLPNAAIATITDMMPATQENIGLVSYGLWLIKNGYASEAINHYKAYVNKEITVKDIAFEIGPQINACGRMGNIELATNFMFATDEDELEYFYNEMINLNEERKVLEKKIVENIFAQDFSKDLMVIVNVPELGGLGGTVASKVVEHFRKPCILLSGNGEILHGSARSFGGISLHALFSDEVKKGNIVDFGGHHAAAGITVRADKIDDLRKSINHTLASLILELSNEEVIEKEPIIEVDDIINLKDITRSTIAPYSELVFFGDFKEPVFALMNLDVIEARSSSNNPDHLCLNLQDSTVKAVKNRYGKLVGKELWIWNKMPAYKEIGEPKKVNLIGKIVPDFRNPKYYSFEVETIIPA